MQKINILGVQITSATLEETLAQIQEFLNSQNQHYIVTPNPEMLVAAQDDKLFLDILNYADLAVADGTGLILGAKISGQKLQRITGVDLVYYLCELCEKQNKRIYFLGGTEGVAAAAAKNLVAKFPNLTIAGIASGGEIISPTTANSELLDQINSTNPDILLVALGHQKQEKWIYTHLDNLPSVKVAIGVGGALDYISGNVKRAPKFLRKIGLEWLYRLFQQPHRWQRIVNAVIVFPYLIIKKRVLG